MKRPRAHLVPLADWTMELLAELLIITGHGDFLFPSRTATGGYISENTFGKIINGMGYKGIATSHGFRSLASSSVLNEQGFDENAIERQLTKSKLPTTGRNTGRTVWHSCNGMLAICAATMSKPAP